jgi:hypothetical protein
LAQQLARRFLSSFWMVSRIRKSDRVNLRAARVQTLEPVYTEDTSSQLQAGE